MINSGMSGVQISAMFAQWLALAICIVAVVISLKRIDIEPKYKADKGFRYIRTGSTLFGMGCFIFGIASVMFRFVG